MVQSSVSHSQQPDLGVRTLLTQALGCVNGILAEGIASATHVNGDDFSKVVRLNETPYVPFVDLFPDTGRLLAGTSDRRRHLFSPTSEGTLLHLIFYDNRQFWSNGEGPARGALNEKNIERAAGRGFTLVRRLLSLRPSALLSHTT